MTKMTKPNLVSETEIAIRFNEVDALGIVWHGNYVKYFEDGREAFGEKFHLNFQHVYINDGFVTPIVLMDCQYKQSLKYGDRAIVQTRYVPSKASKIIFEYSIYRASDRALMCTGKTTQVFVNREGELFYTVPDFFAKWKEKMGF
jgi:acyl-CoA thioester hydrolase